MPSNLKKGLNIPYVTGNASWWQAIKYRNPFDKARIAALYTTGDFFQMKNDGFDHVRIPVDASCVGADPVTGAVQVNAITTQYSVTPSPYPHSTAGENIAELRAMIRRAMDAGLAVVVDLHTIIISERHWEWLVMGRDPDTGQRRSGANKGFDHWYQSTNSTPTYEVHEDYNGLTLETLLFMPVIGQLDANHPLAKFWDTFLTELVQSPINDPTKLYFELMNEPFVNFNQKTWLPAGASWPMLANAYRDNLENRATQWRDVQLNALNVCLSKLPTYKFIVHTAFSDCREFSEERWGTRNGNWHKASGTNLKTLPGFGLAYGPSEVGPTNVGRVIYAAHMYAPLEYTHFGGNSDPEGEYYDIVPDFQGVTTVENWDPMEPSFDEKMRTWQNDNQEAFEGEPGVTGIVRPGILMTEAGVLDRLHDHFLCIRNGETNVCTGPPTFTDPYDATEGDARIFWDRFVWHYDMRSSSTNLTIGWSVYDHSSIYDQSGVHGYIDTHRRIHGYRSKGNLNQHMRDNLFNFTTRPRNF